MKISTATSALVNYPLLAAVDAVHQAGYDGVDIWCGRPHLYRRDHNAEELNRLKFRLKSADLTAVTVMPAFFRYPYSLSSPNSMVRSDSIAYVHDCMKNAVAIDCPQVLIVPTKSLVGQAQEDARTRFADSLSELSIQAERLGVRLGIEVLNPLLSDYAHTTAQVLEFIAEIGSARLGMVLDSGHLRLAGEDLSSAIHAAGERLMEVHFNDNDGKVQQNAVPGEGVIDFNAILHSLRAVNYDGFITMELGWQYSPDPLPALQLALRRTRALLEAA